ncbi:hypothetical protein BD769DRAFT_1393704 [Suillus cothurnatus]|nr:hypothetical protein BD769DRAFT_1393704 [Suillus cothurnatus]
MTNLVVGNLWGFDGPRHAPWPDIMSSVIIYTAAFGILFYVSTILASILRPDKCYLQHLEKPSSYDIHIDSDAPRIITAMFLVPASCNPSRYDAMDVATCSGWVPLSRDSYTTLSLTKPAPHTFSCPLAAIYSCSISDKGCRGRVASWGSLTNYSALSWTQILVVDQSCASKTITESSSEIITIVDSILSSRTSARRQFRSWGMSGRRREVGTGALNCDVPDPCKVTQWRKSQGEMGLSYSVVQDE